MLKFVSPEGVDRMMEQGKSSYRPKQILDLKEGIEGETRAAELAASITGALDPERIAKIVAMKLELDALYFAFAEGRIE